LIRINNPIINNLDIATDDNKRDDKAMTSVGGATIYDHGKLQVGNGDTEVQIEKAEA
jgi:hypothetical protein